MSTIRHPRIDKKRRGDELSISARASWDVDNYAGKQIVTMICQLDGQRDIEARPAKDSTCDAEGTRETTTQICKWA